MRDWVRQVGFGLNMVITTKSSRAGKNIILHCEESGHYRSGKKKIDGMSPKKKRNQKGLRLGLRRRDVHLPYVANSFPQLNHSGPTQIGSEMSSEINSRNIIDNQIGRAHV